MDARHCSWSNLDQAYLKDFFRDNSSTRVTEVIRERDEAYADRDKALTEKKIACNERDAAMVQRDVAYADRNRAWMERDKAIAALTIICSNSDDPEGAAKLLQVLNLIANHSHGGNNLLSAPMSAQQVGNWDEDIPFQRQGKQGIKAAKRETSKKRKHSMNSSQDLQVSKSYKKKQMQQVKVKLGRSKQGETSNSLIPYVPPYDLASTPVPFCSCTGTKRQCYRWGSGGWQSSCCTTFLSAYPLPVNHARRNSRVAGRKMSGGAFKKLLDRLAGTGVDVTQPIDLKNHWAKHGTNKYVTVR
ncbi:hypothetical protein KP509_04G022500 [Ceratopteris richardii]|nr:hypothetical protein KP509_04G022500 [Ceratopteris richardii]KAH7438600.1 hypothetical protein KP509_04G022500 [Ceratopteris richardii]